MAGGWQLNAIGTFQSGLPFTPTMADQQPEYRYGIAVPEIASPLVNCRLERRTIDRWFDASAFRRAGTIRVRPMRGRNILYGPGTRQVDLSLFKNFVFSEGRRLEFRAEEAFNVSNTPQFNNPKCEHRVCRGWRGLRPRAARPFTQRDVAAGAAGVEVLFLGFGTRKTPGTPKEDRGFRYWRASRAWREHWYFHSMAIRRKSMAITS